MLMSMPVTVVSIDLDMVALDMGARLGELLALRCRDVDLDGAALPTTRTARRFSGRGVVYLEPKTDRSRRPVAPSGETVPFESRPAGR